jgi:hydrogenase maturation factor
MIGINAPSANEQAGAEALANAALGLARRFRAGATLWCVAPEWPAHGAHLAVEFVHPVIVGKRALPAVHLEGPDLAASLRLLARPGDVVAVVSDGEDRQVTDLLRRSAAWGLIRLWLAAGRRPGRELAEHVISIEGVDPGVAARSGEVVLRYHLLWELTHVVLEHPGLLAVEPECTDEVCITCSDEGRVGEIRGLGRDGAAETIINGVVETVDVTLVEPVTIGDLVLVHAGVALTTIHADPVDRPGRGSA